MDANPNDAPDDLITVKEAAALACRTPSAIHRLIKGGKLHVWASDPHPRVSRAEVVALVAPPPPACDPPPPTPAAPTPPAAGKPSLMATEKLMSLQAAVNYLLEARGVRRKYHTLYGWATVGVRGVRLETLFVGGCRTTSAEALQRFFEAATPPPPEPRGVTPELMARHEKDMEELRNLKIRKREDTSP